METEGLRESSSRLEGQGRGKVTLADWPRRGRRSLGGQLQCYNLLIRGLIDICFSRFYFSTFDPPLLDC